MLWTNSSLNSWDTVLYKFSSVAQLCPTLRPYGLQHRLPCSLPTPGACSNSCLLSQWCHPTILSSVVPFSSCLQSCPASGSFLMSWLVTSGSQTIVASTLASVLPVNIQGWSPYDWLVWSPCCTRDFQESSPAPEFEGISSSAFCLLYGPTLITVHDHLEDHSLEHTDLCQHSNVADFLHTVQVCHCFPSKKQSSSDL